MKMRLLAAFALALPGVGLLRALAPPTEASQGSLPYYNSRDFTPHWTKVDHQVAPFHLIDQENRRFTERDLDGRIHVASFLFAQCPSLCPTLVQKLKPVHDAIRGRSDVVMVSYTVTPLTDTPEVLAEFGRRRAIDSARWRLLTGDLVEIGRVIRDSYFADDLRPIDGEPASRLLHTEKVLLVDRTRRLRGIYNGTQAFEMERLIEDIATLERESSGE